MQDHNFVLMKYQEKDIDNDDAHYQKIDYSPFLFVAQDVCK